MFVGRKVFIFATLIAAVLVRYTKEQQLVLKCSKWFSLKKQLFRHKVKIQNSLTTCLGYKMTLGSITK